MKIRIIMQETPSNEYHKRLFRAYVKRWWQLYWTLVADDTNMERLKLRVNEKLGVTEAVEEYTR